VEWLNENGTCYSAAMKHLFAQELELRPVTKWVCSPQSNEMAERFVRKNKRDYAELANRPDAQPMMQQLASWFEHYKICLRIVPWVTYPRRCL
jgi:putative transposase